MDGGADAAKAVAVKTEVHQAVLALHRLREQKFKFRTAQISCLRGLPIEFGEVLGKSRTELDKAIPGVLARRADRLPAMLIAGIERRLHNCMREDNACKTIAEIPGAGPLTASAAVATKGNPKAFRSAREFAAWLGLVPSQSGSSGKVAVPQAITEATPIQ